MLLWILNVNFIWKYLPYLVNWRIPLELKSEVKFKLC